MQNGDEAAGRIENIEICQKSPNLFELKNMQIEIINKDLISNFARPAGMHYGRNVSPSGRPICFPSSPSGTGY